MSTPNQQRLGQVLLRRGLISEEELERALELQHREGLRLGSNLLEVGALSEDELLAILGIQRQHWTATGSELQRADPELLTLFPRDVVLELGVVPYMQRVTTLWVAATDPIAPDAEDRLADICGLVVRTALALELRVEEGLHRYYRGPLSPRSESLLRRLDGRRSAGVARAASADETAGRGDDDSTELTPFEVEERRARRSARRDPEGVRGALRALAGAPVTAEVVPEEGVLVEIEEGPALDSASSSALTRIGQAATVDAVADELLDRLGGRFARRLILRREGGRLVGWVADGAGLIPRRIAAIDFPVESSPLLRGLLQSGEPWTGPPPQDRGLSRVLEAVGERPGECGLLVLGHRGVTIGLCYVDSPANRQSWKRDLGRMRRYAEAAARRVIELEASETPSSQA